MPLPVRFRWLRKFFSRQAPDAELADELQHHVELQARKYMLSGLSKAEAQRQAALVFGGTARFTEECREARGTRLLDNLKRDLQQALRAFRHAPAFALTVILTIAVSVSANTTVFAFCYAVLLASLPVPNPHELHLATVQYPGFPDHEYFSYPDQRQTAEAIKPAVVTGFTNTVDFHVGDQSGTTSTVRGQLVVGNFFSVLQVMPLIGRPFAESDNRIGAEPVAAISHRLWVSRFERNPAIIGLHLLIQRKAVTVIAVMPAAFDGVVPGERSDMWLPLSLQSAIGYGGYASMNNVDQARPWLEQDVSWLHLLARTRHDPHARNLEAALARLTKRQIAAQLSSVTDQRERAALQAAKFKLIDASGGIPSLRGRFSLPLQALLALVGILLISACVNIINLLLARSEAQSHEASVRLSLGSSRARLMAQRMTETLLLIIAGGLLSVPLAMASSLLISRWLAAQQSLEIDPSINGPVLAFTAALVFAAGLLVAILPAWWSSDAALSKLLGQRSATGHRGTSRLSSALISLQIAFSVTSLITAGLLAHTLINWKQLDIGVDRRHVLSVSIDPSAAGLNNAAKLNAFYERLVASVNRIPGVVSSAVGGCGLMGNGCATVAASVVGEEKKKGIQLVERNFVGPDYFATIGNPLVRGRSINNADRLDTQVIAVVNQTFERLFLGGQNALDRLIEADGQTVRIVGVVHDSRSDNIHDQAQPFLYRAVAQAPGGWNVSRLEVRTLSDPLALADSIRSTILNLDRAIPIAEMLTLSDETNRGLARELLLGRLSAIFSLLTLALAAIGLYGLLSYRVHQRRSEFAVRLALGATTQKVLRLVSAQAAILWLAGCLGGLGASVAASRLVQSLLFGTGRWDPWTYAVALLGLLLVSLIAVLIPAWRAARIDPASALRSN